MRLRNDSHRPPALLFSRSILILSGLLAAPWLPVRATEQLPESHAQQASINFSGYHWRIKHSDNRVGPGPNIFAAENAFVDSDGNLHLRIDSAGGAWRCAEVISDDSFGYGTYIFTVGSNVDKLDPAAVLGLFTWTDAPDNHHHEIDHEISRWLAPNNANMQYVVQPYQVSANMHRYQLPTALQTFVCKFSWRRDGISFETDGPDGQPIEHWEYTGADTPLAGGENARINLWLCNGSHPTNGEPIEVVIRKFDYRPLSASETSAHSDQSSTSAQPAASASKPRVIFTTLPPSTNMGSGATMVSIAGKVSGVANPAQYKIVLYSKTDQYYVQPTSANPQTPIQADGTWSDDVHPGASYAALLTRSDFVPQATAGVLPISDPAVLAWIEMPGQ